jgi:uncharacterized protein (UPF0297 family)
MSDELSTDTLVAGENVQPVNTATDAETHVEAKAEKSATPKVETRDGKLYVDGVRVYTRDDVNRIGSKAQEETKQRLLTELEVDSFDQVKNVVKQLRTAGDEQGLNVASLRDAVKKKEQTVEELRAELQRVKTDSVLKEHIGNIYNNMPSQWNTEQRAAVVDLMKARNMLHLEGDTFAIRNGDTFLTQDGETPDYAGAVTLIGKTLGLPMAKVGVATYDAPDKSVKETVVKAIDETRLNKDPAYRNAYVQVREKNRNLSRSEITDAMIRKHMESHKMGDLASRQLMTSGSSTTTTKTRR